MTSKKLSRILLLILILGLVVAYHQLGWGEHLTLENLKNQQMGFQNYYQENPLLVAGLYFLIYVASAAFSLPGATLLTLAAGALFGLGLGFLLVSFASTFGATLAFLAARFLLKDSVEARFGERLKNINAGIQKEGAFYLLTLRLIPLFPFFLINLVMGLTPISTLTFFLVSQVGMIPGTLAYVNAGTELAKITSLNGILSGSLIFSFVFIGLVPLFSKALINKFKAQKYLKKYAKPKKFDTNMVVIGGGSAGLVSAYIAAAVKAKVILIEKHKMGGDCLNTGCVPSKAFIRAAKAAYEIQRSTHFGLLTSPPQVDFNKVMARVHQVIRDIEPHDSIERYTGLGVECLQGEAQILSPYLVQVNGRQISTKNIVVATGASPVIPNIPGLKECKPLTSENLWNLKVLPKRLVVLGGGAIGCELAQAFARLGSEVTVVERSANLLSREDSDVSALILENFKKEKIEVLISHQAESVDAHKKTILCQTKTGKKEIPFDEILVALGRKANITGFGLEKLDVEISSQGTISANEYLQTTNYPNIYTCGDVTGPFQFTHTASHQAWYVAVNALFSPFKKFKVDYSVIPWCTFTAPEVARVGLSESEAKDGGVEFEVTRYNLEDLDRAIADSSQVGFVKVLTAPGKDQILGVTIVGERASDMISEFVLAMKHGLGLNKILGTIHIYPTHAEANKYAAGVWRKKNAPENLLRWVEKFHAWRRN